MRAGQNKTDVGFETKLEVRYLYGVKIFKGSLFIKRVGQRQGSAQLVFACILVLSLRELLLLPA